MWKPRTIPASSAAAHRGSQLSRFQSSTPSGTPVGRLDDVQAEIGGVLHLGDGVVDIQERDRRRGHEAVGGQSLDLGDLPLVLGVRRGADKVAVVDQVLPQPERRVDHLAPDALCVEVLDPRVKIARHPGRGRRAR